MNPVLLILAVFIFSSVSSFEEHCYTNVARYEAEELLKTVQTALAAKNVTLFLSAFYESFRPKYCSGGEMGYKDLERIAPEVGAVINNIELKVEEAEFTSHGLDFQIVEQGPNGDTARVYANFVHTDRGFKIWGFDYFGKRCPREARTLLDDNFY